MRMGVSTVCNVFDGHISLVAVGIGGEVDMACPFRDFCADAQEAVFIDVAAFRRVVVVRRCIGAKVDP